MSVNASLNMFTNFGSIRRDVKVKVYMGADWQRGYVIGTSATSCSVQLPTRAVTVYDLRNIKPA